MNDNQTKLVNNLQNALSALRQGDIYNSNGLGITREEVFQHVFYLTGDTRPLNPQLSDGTKKTNQQLINEAEEALNDYSETFEVVASDSTPKYQGDTLLERSLGTGKDNKINESQIAALNTIYEAPTEPEYQPLSDFQIRSDFQSSFREAFAEMSQQFKNPSSGDSPFSSALEHTDLKKNINMVRDEIFGRAKSKIMDKIENKIKNKVMKSAAGKAAKAAAKKMLAKISTKIATKIGLSAAGAVMSGGATLVLQAALEVAGKLKKLGENLLSKLGINVKKWRVKNSALLGMGAILLAPLAVGSSVAAVGMAGLGAAAFASGGVGAFAGGASLIIGGIFAIITFVIGMAIVPIVVTMLGLPLLLSLIIFVITASSYVSEPAPAIEFKDTGRPDTGNGKGGDYPACWPTFGRITQGPLCSSDPDWTHCIYDLNAIDIAGVHGTYVYATHDGTVKVLSGGGYGDYVTITSTHGFYTLYGHLYKIYVTSGQQVSAGDLIGSQNGDPINDTNPGNSDGTHLHYEIRGVTDSINNYVPSYSIGDTTGPCFAKDEGGSDKPPVAVGGDCSILASSAEAVANGLGLHPNPITDTTTNLDRAGNPAPPPHVYSHGVWDFWNYNTQYLNQYWDESWYQDPAHANQDAGPCATCIFWCTALVTEAYNSAGLPFSDYMSVAYVGNMMNWFKARGRYYTVDQLPADQVPAGSALFFGNHHVAMILGVSGQLVFIAESNSYPHGHFFEDPSGTQGRNPVNTSRVVVVDNKIITAQGSLAVTGYGIPPESCSN